MKPSSIYSIIGAVATLGALAGGVIAIDDRYTHQDNFTSFVMDYQTDRIENNVDKIQQRIWQLQDRRDVEKKAKKDTIEFDLKHPICTDKSMKVAVMSWPSPAPTIPCRPTTARPSWAPCWPIPS